MNHLSDILCFGALPLCSICHDGKFILDNSVYRCTGYDSEWSKCDNTIKEPLRGPVKIPRHYKERLGIDFAARTRILRNVVEISDHDIE